MKVDRAVLGRLAALVLAAIFFTEASLPAAQASDDTARPLSTAAADANPSICSPPKARLREKERWLYVRLVGDAGPLHPSVYKQVRGARIRAPKENPSEGWSEQIDALMEATDDRGFSCLAVAVPSDAEAISLAVNVDLFRFEPRIIKPCGPHTERGKSYDLRLYPRPRLGSIITISGQLKVAGNISFAEWPTARDAYADVVFLRSGHQQIDQAVLDVSNAAKMRRSFLVYRIAGTDRAGCADCKSLDNGTSADSIAKARLLYADDIDREGKRVSFASKLSSQLERCMVIDPSVQTPLDFADPSSLKAFEVLAMLSTVCTEDKAEKDKALASIRAQFAQR